MLPLAKPISLFVVSLLLLATMLLAEGQQKPAGDDSSLCGGDPCNIPNAPPPPTYIQYKAAPPPPPPFQANCPPAAVVPCCQYPPPATPYPYTQVPYNNYSAAMKIGGSMEGVLLGVLVVSLFASMI